MKTVHCIGNAHLDPVWLWSYAEGVDAVLATTRSACDRLDEYPGFVMTCSASWFHRQVERHDPALFERVRAFVRQGRWQIVGGMVIQPDCNAPSAESFARQLQAGQRYFRERLGAMATVGYNVDSFGHTAYLPRFLSEAGLDSYCFQRPMAHEKVLPARLFRWRSPDGHEVLAFRIGGAYTTRAVEIREHVELSLTDLPDGIEHTMCFFGVGDHGGGPTRAQIDWILEHAGDFPGARLVLSHPRAFFDAVAPLRARLPTVTGELQQHAIGCYSVERRIKTAMRRAEACLLQAEAVSRCLPEATPPGFACALEPAWDAVLFNQFHDVLGGTCIEEGSRLAAADMTWAESEARRLATLITRRTFRRRAEPGTHRVVVFNPHDEPFSGLLAHEPWCEGQTAGDANAETRPALLAEDGRELPVQRVDPRGKVELPALLFPVTVPARACRVLTFERRPRIAAGADGAGLPSPVALPQGLAHGPLTVACASGRLDVNGWAVSVGICDDPSDTWSHSCLRSFDGPAVGEFLWRDPWEVTETGPLRAAIRSPAAFHCSRAWARAEVRQGEAAVRLRLSVVWAEERRRLVLRLVAPQPIVRRTDLVSGGAIDRPADGEEYPLNGGLLVRTADRALGVVAPGVFSLSVDPRQVALTLLRSPYAAHHDPFPAEQRPDHPVTDQGSHEFDIILWPAAPPPAERLAILARECLTPPLVWDLTG